MLSAVTILYAELTLTLHLGGLLGGSFWGGGIKLSLCLNLVRVILETSNLARNYIHVWPS